MFWQQHFSKLRAARQETPPEGGKMHVGASHVVANVVDDGLAAAKKARRLIRGGSPEQVAAGLGMGALKVFSKEEHRARLNGVDQIGRG